MKQKDIALILVVVFFAGIFSLVLTKTVFVPGKNKQLTAETAPVITAEFKKPDTNVFNDQAINPTQLIQIGDNSNPQPF